MNDHDSKALLQCCRCFRRLTADEAMYYESACEGCERRLARRWDDQYQRPTKFTQRLAVIMAMAVIAACLVVIFALLRTFR